MDGLIWFNNAETRDTKRPGGARMNEIEAKRMTEMRASFRYRETARIADYVVGDINGRRCVGVVVRTIHRAAYDLQCQVPYVRSTYSGCVVVCSGSSTDLCKGLENIGTMTND